MKTADGFTAMTAQELAGWLAAQKVGRRITRLQLHHTYQPDYAAWNKRPDALYWQKAMRDFHVNGRGFADIAQHFSVCPDGTVVSGRSLDKDPAGITGGNSGAICIECIGNFDAGADVMTSAQRSAVITAAAAILSRFSLTVEAITYHCWWTSGGTNLGDYDKYKSAKTCPGTGFFGGNTRQAFEKEFKKEVEAKMNNKEEEIDLEELEALKKQVTELAEKNSKQDEIINIMGGEIDELRQKTLPRWDYIDENMPEWARETIAELTASGALKGDSDGKLGLSENMLRELVVIARMMKA